MPQTKRYTLRTRVLAVIVSFVLFGFIATIAVLTYQASAMQHKLALQYAEQLAKRNANEVTSKLGVALDAARALAQSLGGLKAAGLADRAAADAMLKSVLVGNPEFLGVWTGWEAGAFDGKDSQFAGKPGHDTTGRYVPYWNRGGGAIRLEPLADYDKDGAGDYYQLAKKSGDESIIEPFTYNVAGKDVLMTSVAVPVFVNGKIVGVTGVDIALADFQKEIGEIRLYEDGYASLISNSGKYVSDLDAANVGKDIGNDEGNTGSGDAASSARMQIAAGQEFTRSFYSDVLKAEVTRLYVPVRIGATRTPWSFSITVPEDKILADVNRLRNTALLLGLVSVLIVSVGLSLVLDRLVIKPIGGEPEDAANIANTVAQGDLSVRINVREGDTSSLMVALRNMQTQLAGVVSTVRANADRVATASTQIAQGNDDLSSRTQEQASALEQAAASMEEMTATVKQTADNAKQANQLAIGVRRQADAGGSVVSRAVGAMSEINASSKRIADIISVIDEIAFQTNLLALNAAVEAARAGEQGRGFAVVASEVRNLAQRSASAAKEIKDLIQDSVHKVTAGSALVDQSGKALHDIVNSVKKLTDVVAEISTASQEQAAGIDQVNNAVTQMDQGTQQNAALVEESAAAAESLKDQAQRLVEAAAVFKLADNQLGSAAPLPQAVSTVLVERRGPNRAKNVVRPNFRANRSA